MGHLNISSGAYHMTDEGGGLVFIKHLRSKQVRTVMKRDIPSAHELAMMHENEFNSLCRKLSA